MFLNSHFQIYIIFSYPIIVYKLWKSIGTCLVYNEMVSYIIWFLDIPTARLIDICAFENANSADKRRL